METKNETMKISCPSLKENVFISSETSLIVPDRYPDILKILEADSSAYLLKKTVKDGRLSLEGEISLNIIYLPEGTDEIKTLSTTFDFNEVFNHNELSDSTYLIAVPDIDSLDVNLINSRKVSAKANVKVKLYGLNNKDISFVKEYDENNACAKMSQFDSFLVLDCQEKEVSIKEKCDVPNATEILKSDYTVGEIETKTVGNKIVIKGAVFATTLYRVADSNISCLKSRFPFTEVFETGELLETDSVYINYDFTKTKAALVDALPKIVAYDISLRLTAIVTRESKTDYASDLFYYGKETELEFKTETIPYFIKHDKVLKNFHEIIQTSDMQDNIESVYNVFIKPEITEISDSDGECIVSIKMHTNILYLNSNQTGCLNFDFNLNHKSPKRTDTKPIFKLNTENISYNITNGAVELRGNLIIECTEIIEKDCTFISDANEKELKRENELIIFFANSDETIWDISKRYKVNPKDVMDLNSIEDDKIKTGQRVIIPCS